MGKPRKLGVVLCVAYTAARLLEWAATKVYVARCRTSP
jgi:hypothetical protein